MIHRAVLLAPGTPWCLGKRAQGDYTIQAAADRWLSWKDDCRQIQTRPATRACYFIIRLVLAGFTLRQGVVHRAVLLAPGTPWCLGERAQGDYTIQAAADRWLSWKDDCRQIQTRPATRACYFIIRLVLAGFTLRQGVVHRAVLLALGTPWCLGKRAQGDYTIQAAADG